MPCWKCGGPTNAGAECDRCAQGQPEMHPSTTVWSRMPEMLEVDFAKVHTFDDLKQVLSSLRIHVPKGSELHKRLSKFLKDNPLS